MIARSFLPMIAIVLFAAVPVSMAQDAPAANTKELQDFDFANGLYQRKMMEAAAQKYSEFLKEFPASGKRDIATFRLAESHYQHSLQLLKKQPVEAKIALVEAQFAFGQYIKLYQDGDRYFDALLRHGEISYKLDDAKQGLESLQIVLKNSKEATQVEAALFYSARCYETLKQPDEAIRRYRQIRDTYPKGNFAAFSTYLLAQLLEAGGNYSEAADLLNRLWRNADQYKIEEGSNLIEKTQLLSAQILYRMDRFGDAAEAYDAYIRENPNGLHLTEAKYGAAWAHYRQKDYAKALEVAKTLQRQTLTGELVAGLVFLQGTCSYQQKQYDDAISFFQEVIADPKAGDYRQRAWYQLAWAYFLTNDYDAAVRECQNLLRQSLGTTMSANVHFLQGQSYAKSNRLEEAVAEMELVRSIGDESEYSEETYYLLGDYQYRLKQYSKAAEAFARYAERYPDSDRARDAMKWAANAHYAGKDYEAAVQDTDRLLERFPDQPGRGGLLYRKGLAQYQLNQWDKAKATFQTVLHDGSASKNHPDALYWTAFIYEKQDDLPSASSTYANLLHDFPNYKNADDVRLRKAYCDYKTGDLRSAYNSFHRLLFSDAGKSLTPEIVFWLVVQSDERGDHKEALNIANRILELFSDGATQERASIAKGNQLVALKEWDQAIQNSEAFLQRFPDSKFKPEIYWSQARGYEGKNNLDKALERYNQSLLESQKLGSPDPVLEATLYVDRGKIYESRKNYAAAVESFLRVAILYDHDELSPEAMFRGVHCHLELNEASEAAMLYHDLQTQYKESEWAKQAREQFGNRFEIETTNGSESG